MEIKTENIKLAQLIFPTQNLNFSDIEASYPKRNLHSTSKVVRVAPSPTGFAHFGLIFASMINEQVASLSEGIFFLRIEDTDKKREVENGIEKIVSALKDFDINYSEGPVSDDGEIGNYGPYIQSNRQEIYFSAAKLLVEKGFAYPCFCKVGELERVRQVQEGNKERTGYYGKYAKCRNLTHDEIKQKIEAGETFTVRFRSPDTSTPSKYHDAIKGDITLPTNDVDYIIVKSSDKGLGLPVYHLAAMVDDHLQGVNLVIRGDEWLSSLPLHLQIIEAFGWQKPEFGHLSPVMKTDGGTSKRKLSKRKDPEAAVSYYLEQGIPSRAVRAYVLNIADSSFEDWRKNNQYAQLLEFPLVLSRMGSSGALFDMTKFLDICKQEISNMSSEEIYFLTEAWSRKYNFEFHEIFTKDREYSEKILGIERSGEKKRKDISQWSQLPDFLGFFYDEIYQGLKFNPVSENIKNPEEVSRIVNKYLASYKDSISKDEWFNSLKKTCLELGYADSMKDYKTNPEKFSGHIGDVAMILRYSLTGRTTTPDLFEMIQVMGKDRVVSRLKKYA